MVRTVKNPEERRADIINAACALFLSKGYENTTMKDVMVRLGIAKGTIYHYFSSKEDLLEAVICLVAEQEVARQAEAIKNCKGNALERMRLLTLAGAHDSSEHGDLLEHLHKPANTGMHIRLLAHVIMLQAPFYATLIEEGCREGIFTTAHPLECAEFLLAGFQFMVDQGIHPWTEEQLIRRWRAFPVMAEALLQAPAGSFSFLHELTVPDISPSTPGTASTT